MGTFPKVRPETGAILFGNCGNAGVAEGTARLPIKEGDVGSVRPGEILVCPATYGSWSPIYPLLKGVVTDGGGSVSHACIVGREYNIPVVANTGTATYTLKTGDKIRLKADEGLVFRID
jgi:phosphoenolpyruvate synthase/pyruvate phosphate dikinase